MAGNTETLKRGLKSHGKTEFLSPMNEVEAMGELTVKGAAATVGRPFGKNENMKLSPNAEAFVAKTTKKKGK